MKRIPLLIALGIVCLVFAACSGGIKSDLSIPKDAAIVFHINSGSLSSKLSWEEIKATEWYKEVLNEAKDSLGKKILENPAASGVDTDKDFAFFMQRKGRGGIGVFEGNIADAAAFANMAKSMSKVDAVKKDGEWNMLEASKSSLVAWNDDRFALITDLPDLGKMNPMAGEKSTSFSNDSLKVFIKEIMSLDGDKSLFDDDRFAKMMKEDADMHMWVNSSAIYADMLGMMSMMKIGSLFQDNVTAASINFEDGKISVKSQNYFGKELSDFFKKYEGRKVDAAVLNRIPSQNIIGVMAGNFDPESIKEFFKYIGADGFLNMMLAESNMTVDEIFDATTGQFVMALTDLQMKDTTITYDFGEGEPYTSTTSSPDMNVLFASGVNKKSLFEKMLTALKGEAPEMPFSYQLTDKWFAAGNKQATIDAFMTGKTTDHAFTSKISGHPFGMYLDLKRLLQTNFSKDSAAIEMLNASANVWEDMVATTNEFKDGSLTSEMVINMVDKKTNSLKQLNQFIEKMYTIQKKHKPAFDAMDEEIISDSLMVMPPPAE